MDGQGLGAGGRELQTGSKKAGAPGACHRLSCEQQELGLELQLVPSALQVLPSSVGTGGGQRTPVLLILQMKFDRSPGKGQQMGHLGSKGNTESVWGHFPWQQLHFHQGRGNVRASPGGSEGKAAERARLW